MLLHESSHHAGHQRVHRNTVGGGSYLHCALEPFLNADLNRTLLIR